MTSLAELDSQIHIQHALAENDLSANKDEKYKQFVQNTLNELDQMEISADKTTKTRILYLRGKTYDILDSYNKLAEEALTKAVSIPKIGEIVSTRCWMSHRASSYIVEKKGYFGQ